MAFVIVFKHRKSPPQYGCSFGLIFFVFFVGGVLPWQKPPLALGAEALRLRDFATLAGDGGVEVHDGDASLGHDGLGLRVVLALDRIDRGVAQVGAGDGEEQLGPLQLRGRLQAVYDFLEVWGVFAGWPRLAWVAWRGAVCDTVSSERVAQTPIEHEHVGREQPAQGKLQDFPGVDGVGSRVTVQGSSPVDLQ